MGPADCPGRPLSEPAGGSCASDGAQDALLDAVGQVAAVLRHRLAAGVEVVHGALEPATALAHRALELAAALAQLALDAHARFAHVAFEPVARSGAAALEASQLG